MFLVKKREGFTSESVWKNVTRGETARDLQRDFIPGRIHVGKNDLIEGIEREELDKTSCYFGSGLNIREQTHIE